MDRETLAFVSLVVSAVTAFFWKLWDRQAKEHRRLREDDREDRKALTTAIHSLRSPLQVVAIRLDRIEGHLGIEAPDIETSYDGAPQLRSVPSNGKKDKS